MHPIETSAMWGALGAFIFAGPRLSACLYTSRVDGGPISKCILDFVVSVSTGAICAAAGGAWAAEVLGALDPYKFPAVAAGIGFFANKVAPYALDKAPGLFDWLIARITGRAPRETEP